MMADINSTTHMTQLNDSAAVTEFDFGSVVTCLSSSDLFNALKYMVYFLEGVVMFAGNILLLFPILFHAGMRNKKEYLLVGGLALADALNGFGYLVAGLHRISVIMAGEHKILVSRWECLMIPSNMIWFFDEINTGMMMTMISLDRLLLVTFPMWYLTQGAPYGWCMCGICFAHNLISGAVGVYRVWLIKDDRALYKTKDCFLSFAMDDLHNKYHVQMLSYSALASVIIYVLVLVLYKKRSAKINTRMNETQAKKQRQMTVSLGISSAFTLVLFVIPIFFDVIVTHYLDVPKTIVVFLYITANTNCIMNLFIFLVRDPIVRRGLVAALKFQKLPIDTAKWIVKPK